MKNSKDLSEAIVRYQTLGNKKVGRPKKAMGGGVDPHILVAMKPLLKDPHCDKDLFLDVLFTTKDDSKEKMPKCFIEWEAAIDRREKAAEQLRDMKKKEADLEYEAVIREEVKPAKSELSQMKHLANEVEINLQTELAKAFLRDMMSRKNSDPKCWYKVWYNEVDKKYRHENGIYGGLRKWIKDQFGYTMEIAAIKKAFQRTG
jgi:hypothetical protein